MQVSNPYLDWCKLNKLDFTDATAWQDFYNLEILSKVSLSNSTATLIIAGYPLFFFVKHGRPLPNMSTQTVFQNWRQNKLTLSDDHLEFREYHMKPVTIFAQQIPRAFSLVSKGVILEGAANDYIVDYGTHRIIMDSGRFNSRFVPTS